MAIIIKEKQATSPLERGLRGVLQILFLLLHILSGKTYIVKRTS